MIIPPQKLPGRYLRILVFLSSWLTGLWSLSLLYWKLIVYDGFAAPPHILSLITEKRHMICFLEHILYSIYDFPKVHCFDKIFQSFPYPYPHYSGKQVVLLRKYRG